MKEVRESARVGDTAIYQLARILKMRGVAFPLLSEHIQTDFGGGEILAQAVVKFTSNAAPLLVLYPDQLH